MSPAIELEITDGVTFRICDSSGPAVMPVNTTVFSPVSSVITWFTGTEAECVAALVPLA